MPGSLTDFSSLHNKLQKTLSVFRFQHVCAVAALAQSIALDHHVSPQRAYLAGLLHDCARDLPPRLLKKNLERYSGRFAPRATIENPCLWHNPVGVYLAKNQYHIKDTLILRAIGIHSTGDTQMNPLDQLIYVSDFCEPNRHHAAARVVRKLLFDNLSAAVRRVTEEKIHYLIKHQRTIHPWTLALAREQGIKIKT